MADMKLTIDRKTWMNADNLANLKVSSLLTADGRRCCLGFLGRACGIPDSEMRGVGTPARVGYAGEISLYGSAAETYATKWLDGVLSTCNGYLEDAEWTRTAVALNDAGLAPNLTCGSLFEEGAKHYPEVPWGDNYRERLLTAHFAAICVELSFQD